MAIPKEPEFTEAIDTSDNDQQLQIPNELRTLRDIVIIRSCTALRVTRIVEPLTKRW